MQLYVDGSAKGQNAAWSVAIVFQNYKLSQTRFAGAFGDRLYVQANHPRTLGEDEPNALQAEQCAICWGLLWLMQFLACDAQVESCTIMFDCQAAGFGASGLTAGPHTSPLSQIARGLTQVISERYGNLQWQHTPAHQCHPWNELVDVLAKTIIGVLPMPSIELARPPDLVAETARSVQWDWGWLSVAADTDAFPRVEHGRLLWDSAVRPSTIQPTAMVPTTVGRADCAGDNRLFLRVFSMNVQSLKGKHKLIEEQALHHKVDVLSLQETHTDDGFIETSAYHRFASPSSHHWGTAVWVRKKVFVGDVAFAVAAEHLHQVLAKPRLLLVLLRLGTFTALLGSVHLPQQARGHAERREVLGDLDRTLGNLFGVDLVALGVDANARLPCNTDGATGDVTFDDEDDCGVELLHFMQRHSLYAPSTHSSCHTGPSFTWQHARGQLSRIDYVLVRTARQVSR